MFIESTRAHNTVEIDGLNFSRFRLDKYGSALNRVVTIGDCTIMEGVVHHKRLIDSMIPNNKITLADSIEVDLTHRRIIFHKPNYFLAVVDVLSSTENHDYTQWFHLSPNLNAEIISESLLEVKDSTGKVHSTIHHLHDESNDSKVTLTSGQKKPRRQGFHSINGLELIPHQTLGFSINSDKGVLSTVFDLKGGKKKPYLNIGSNGKYIRFAISQDETETDIKIREQSDGSVLVESSNTTELFKEIFSAN